MGSESYSLDFICGLGAAVSTTIITFPVNKLIYRQILQGGNLMRAFDSLKQEGFFFLYRGVLPPMTQKSIALTSMFGVFHSVTLPLKKFHLNPYVEKLCGSTVSGSLEAACMPFERVLVLLVDSKYNDRFRNMFHAFYELKVHYGIKEYYRGLTLLWIRNIASNSCFFITKAEFEKMTKVYDSRYKEGVKNFLTGGILGVLMATLFYPLKVMKIIVHKDVGGRFISIRELAILVYKKDNGGITNFYQGVVLNGWRSLLSWGLTNMMFEFLQNVFSTDPGT